MSDRPTSKVPDHPFAIGVRGVHHSQISQINQRAVLTLVGTHPGITNAEISRRSGLGAQTVSRFLLDLEEKGLIRRGSVLRGHAGQPATPYFLIYESVSAIGVEVGWRGLDIVLTDMSGEVRHARRLDYGDADGVADDAGQLCADLLSALNDAERRAVTGLALAVPEGHGTHMRSRDASHCARVADAVTAASGLKPLWFDSGNAAAWAEHVGPESRWNGSLFYVHLDTHIASGCVLDGVLWRGGRGSGVRLGMLRQGRRILDDIASLGALDRRLVRNGGRGLPVDARYWPRYWPLNRQRERIGTEFEAWLGGAAAALASAILSAHALIGFAHVLIGGPLPHTVAERLVERILDVWRPQIARGADLPNIEVGRIGPSAPAIGASYRAIHDRLFSREMLVS